MIETTNYARIKPDDARLLINIITGYESRNPNISVFMKRPDHIAIISSKIPDVGDLSYYNITFRDFDNRKVCFEMITEPDKQYVLKYTGSRKNLLNYFLTDGSEYTNQSWDELQPIFIQLEDLIKNPDKDRVKRAAPRLNMYNYNPVLNKQRGKTNV